MRRVIVSLVILSLVAPLAAQQAQTSEQGTSAPPQNAPPTPPNGVSQVVGWTEAEKADLNRRIRRFQSSVQSAVENGGSRLAERAKKLVNQIELAMSGPPEINPVFFPGIGYHFDVQVPDILGSTLLQYAYYRKQLDRIVVNPPPAGDKVTANTVVKPDSMVGGVDFEPSVEYAVFVRQELIDAMLESSTVLHIKPEEWLIVSARVPTYAQQNPLEHHRRIVLQIRGTDLIAFRQRQIDKEQAKERILEFRY